MSKILAQTGMSLADSYDVEGSICDISDLLTKEGVNLTQEMGATIVSERMQSSFLELRADGILQSVAFNVVSDPLPDCVNRLLGACVIGTFSATGTGVSACSLAIRDNVTGREYPFWAFDTVAGLESAIFWSDDGAAVAEVSIVEPTISSLPEMVFRQGAAKLMPSIVFRGEMVAFGAGTPDVIAMIHLGRASATAPGAGEPRSHGLPMPGW